MKKFEAYLITNTLNEAKYVGISSRGVAYRWRAHKRDSMADSPTGKLHRAMKKYGVDNFVVEHIACSTSMHDLLALEKQLIAQNKSHVDFGGYNLTTGGEGTLYSEEARQRMGARYRRGVSATPEQANFLRKIAREKRQPESQKMSASLKMKKWWKENSAFRLATSDRMKARNRSTLAILNEEKVIAIRSRLAAGEKCSSLAREYGVAGGTVSDIYGSKKWLGIGDEKGCERRRLIEVANNLTVANFVRWAAWCGYRQREIAQWAKLHQTQVSKIVLGTMWPSTGISI